MSARTRVAWIVLFFVAPLAASTEPAVAPAEDAPAEFADGVVATVNGEPIYHEDIERRLVELHSGLSATERGAMDMNTLMFRLINDTLFAQEARALGMQDEDPIPQRLEQLRRRLAVAHLEQIEVRSRVNVTDEDIKEAFERDYRTASFHVVTAYELEDAEALHERLAEGADIEELAEEESIDQYSARAGRVKNVAFIDIPSEIADVLFDPLKVPQWFMTAVIVLLALGFPFALIMAWAFQLTSEGVKRDAGTITADESPLRTHHRSLL